MTNLTILRHHKPVTCSHYIWWRRMFLLDNCLLVLVFFCSLIILITGLSIIILVKILDSDHYWVSPIRIDCFSEGPNLTTVFEMHILISTKYDIYFFKLCLLCCLLCILVFHWERVVTKPSSILTFLSFEKIWAHMLLVLSKIILKFSIDAVVYIRE